MKTMILCAGRGERMRPLTDHQPKPLLEVGGRTLIEWHIERLRQAGLRDIVINHAWLGAMIENALGDGRRLGVRITYSPEATALETAGGIAQALPLLGAAPFLVVNGDIFCAWDFRRAGSAAQRLTASDLVAWLVLVPNPPQHPQGDFTLDAGRIGSGAGTREKLSFSGIGVYQPRLFAAVGPGEKAGLAPLLRGAMDRQAVAGERFDGPWTDVGTPARLAELDSRVRGMREQA